MPLSSRLLRLEPVRRGEVVPASWFRVTVTVSMSVPLGAVTVMLMTFSPSVSAIWWPAVIPSASAGLMVRVAPCSAWAATAVTVVDVTSAATLRAYLVSGPTWNPGISTPLRVRLLSLASPREATVSPVTVSVKL